MLLVAFAVSGIFAFAAPSASADDVFHYDVEGTIRDDVPEPGDPLVCLNPHIEIFGNVLLEDPICI